MTDQMPMPQIPDVTPMRTDVPPRGPDGTPRRLGGRGALVALGVVAGLLVGAGVTWWAVAGGDDAMSHVEISGGKLAKERNDLLDEGEQCDDRDKFEYNDCDANTTYSFHYEITNRGGEPANYTVIVNGFDDEGDFVGQAYVSSTHLGPGETDSAEGDFDEYVELADKHTLADIDSLRVAHVERLPLAN
jgi:hypothetical protein